MPNVTTIYNQSMQRVAMLENAFGISYDLPMDSLWMASFSLPATDPKNEECQSFRFVEIFDNEKRVDLFRILPNTARRDASGETISYQCEHVLGTLLDDVLFQAHTVGNLGVFTSDVLAYLLSKQTTVRWQLGTVDFTHQYEYNWENDNLLAALYSVPTPFAEAYMWSWDTSSLPWTLNLVSPPSGGASAYIRYGRNMMGIERTIDPATLCTRLYPLGYGEGVNQLGIGEVNGGTPYLDAPTAAQYGVVSKIWVDQRYTNAETLKAAAQALLNELQMPKISYSVQAADLYPITGELEDSFWPGQLVRVIDDDLGIDLSARLIKVNKGDVMGNPGAVTLEIANKSANIAQDLADLENRTRIQEVYAQGATNIDTRDFADNADPGHPAKLRFYVPAEAVRINKVLLNWTSEPFRAYSKAIAAAPAITSGPSTRETAGPSSRSTSGPSSTNTTGPKNVEGNTQTEGTYFGSGGHNHGIPSGTQFKDVSGVTWTWVPSGNHSHFVSLPNHDHEMTHTHEIDHTHSMDHTHEIPSHTHDIDYGIYEGPTPTTIQITVDGTLLPTTFPANGEVDLRSYLSQDGAGKIQRGTFHEIQIAPISLGRIVASVVTQIFVASRGGGNY